MSVALPLTQLLDTPTMSGAGGRTGSPPIPRVSS